MSAFWQGFEKRAGSKSRVGRFLKKLNPLRGFGEKAHLRISGDNSQIVPVNLHHSVDDAALKKVDKALKTVDNLGNNLRRATGYAALGAGGLALTGAVGGHAARKHNAAPQSVSVPYRRPSYMSAPSRAPSRRKKKS